MRITKNKTLDQRYKVREPKDVKALIGAFLLAFMGGAIAFISIYNTAKKYPQPSPEAPETTITPTPTPEPKYSYEYDPETDGEFLQWANKTVGVPTKAPVKAPVKIVKVTSAAHSGIQKQIADMFPEEPNTMIAVAKQESSLNPRAMNWNCYYSRTNKKTGKQERYSTFCKKEDRPKAHSVDCGLMQINVPGAKTCPESLYDVQTNLKRARAKYDTKQGKKHWSAYTSGAYRSHL
jgi:hypothetical protein